MESERDTQKDKQVFNPSFINKGQNPHYQNDSILGSQNLGLDNKTEKLITALYMVTDFIEKDEPIRHKLRSLGLSLISDSQSKNLPSSLSIMDMKRRPDSVSVTSEIISLINISSSIGLISKMNSSILIREFSNMKSSLEVKFSNMGILNNFFENESLQNGDIFFEKKLPQSPFLDKGQSYKGHNNVPYKTKGQVINTQNSNGQKRDTVSDNVKNERRDSIIKLIKEKGEVTIKDITSIVSDCSEKTVQRELLSLLKDNLIKKTGEKRWSRYFLNK